MKNQKGFIQIPLLIAIIAGVLVISGVGYFGVRQYQNYQTQKTAEKQLAQEVERNHQEKERQAQELAEAQQITLEEAKSEIEKLKQQSAESKKKQEILEQTQNSEISSKDLEPYLEGIVLIECKNKVGSGSLWKLSQQNYIYKVLTNYHVIESEKEDCGVSIQKLNGDFGSGSYDAILSSKSRWNNVTDSAVLDVKIDQKANDLFVKYMGPSAETKPVSELDYKISSISLCDPIMPSGSPVAIVGYPSFATQYLYSAPIFARTITDGIISAYEKLNTTIDKLPYPDYFVSNKIDSGNSGGIAFSKNNNQLCVLGIPTWLNKGNYETQGVVQNIHNIFYKN